jgi:hypothetical protein
MKRLAAVLVVLTSSLAFADYGAIAYSFSTGLSGQSWSYGDQASAEQSAVGYCGQADCRSLVWVSNQCAAVAAGDNEGYGWGLSGDRGAARATALAHCESVDSDCHVAADVCT